MGWAATKEQGGLEEHPGVEASGGVHVLGPVQEGSRQHHTDCLIRSQVGTKELRDLMVVKQGQERGHGY